MILYFDTSSLVKLYIDEEHTKDVKCWAEDAELIATSRVAYPEAVAAFARRHRNGDLDKPALIRIHEALTQQWEDFAVVDVDEIKAGELALKHALRGFDAIHLEAAIRLRGQATEVTVSFSSFDRQLNRAAAAEGFQILGSDGLAPL
ncbi:MAG: type II toxin-antitoxin system VapC family toxin [Gammaproteobacteria bacterium]